MTSDRRIDGVLVCGGKYHDIDFVRLKLLGFLSADERVRVTVASDYASTDDIKRADFLISYTCDVRPTDAQQREIEAWLRLGGRWLALHGTNCALDAPTSADGVFSAPRALPLWTRILGSQFLSHPPKETYVVTPVAAQHGDPLIAGIDPFEVDDELYLMSHEAGINVLLETRWTGTTPRFADSDWLDDASRPVLYRRPIGRGEIVYFTLGHRRGHWDMIHPPFDGSKYPIVEPGAWTSPVFVEVLTRCLTWVVSAEHG